MKGSYNICGLLLAMLTIGCADDPGASLNVETPVAFYTGIANTTRTSTRDNVWNGDEQISISDTQAEIVKTYSPDAAGASVSLSPYGGPDGKDEATRQTNTLFWPIDKGDRTFEAWYPKQDTKPKSFTVEADQSSIDDETFNGYDLLYASSGQLSSGSTVTLNFYHQMAHVIVYIRGLAWSGQEIESITFGKDNVAVTGKIEPGTTGTAEASARWTVDAADQKETITLRNQAGTLTYECLLPPQTVGSANTPLLMFNTKTKESDYEEDKGPWDPIMANVSYPFNAPISLEAGKEYSFFIRLERVGLSVASTITDWDANVSQKEVEAIYQPITMGGRLSEWESPETKVEDGTLDFTYTE